MGGWKLPPPLLLGAAAAAAAAVAWLHTQRQEQPGRVLLDGEHEEAPRAKRGGICYPRTDKWDSTWGKMLTSIRERRDAEIPDTRAKARFKSRCRLPFGLFEHILGELCGKDGYVASNDRDARAPLMFMAVLRIAGRGWCFDDVGEHSGISSPPP